MTDRPKIDLDAYRVPQKPGEGVAAFFGTWPGDETDEEITRLLADQDDPRTVADAVRKARESHADAVRLAAELSTILKADAIPAWWDTADPALGGETPADVWLSGERVRVWRIVREMQEGGYA